ncbi:hypothetical protein EDD85DRAFT_784083 [Armillaria nabsnona]|nr:hypothetical protein EDD85DRAFT_784083 [Armillaria nabsnona]
MCFPQIFPERQFKASVLKYGDVLKRKTVGAALVLALALGRTLRRDYIPGFTDHEPHNHLAKRSHRKPFFRVDMTSLRIGFNITKPMTALSSHPWEPSVVFYLSDGIHMSCAHLCCDNDVDDMGLSQYGVVKMAIKVPQFLVHEGAPKASGFISEHIRDTKFHPLTEMEHGDYSFSRWQGSERGDNEDAARHWQ